MIYSREYLNDAKKSFEEATKITQTLINALVAKEHLTLSEAKFIGPFLENAKTNDQAGKELLNSLYNELPEYRFWCLYMMYHNDIFGEGTIIGPFGSISQSQKESDLAFLDTQYQQWKIILYNLKNSKTDLQYLTKESREDIKEALNYSRQIGEGSRRREMIERTLVLHSKYVYSKIMEYYQEYDVKQDIINLCGREIIVDSFAYAHIAIRHMVDYTKFGRPGKTFIYDRKIDIDCLPRILIGFLEDYVHYIGCPSFNPKRIFLRFNGRDYVIRFRELIRQVKGGENLPYLRLETFYPAELRNDANLVKTLSLCPVNDILGFYI